MLHGRFPCYCTHLRSMARYHLELKYLYMMGSYNQDFCGEQYYYPRKIQSFQPHLQHELNCAARHSRNCLYIDLLPTDAYVVEFVGNTKVDQMDEYPNS